MLLGQDSTRTGPSAAEQQCLASTLPLLQKHALSTAESTLLDCRQKNPQSAILSNALGIVYEQEGRNEDASAAFEEALALLPAFTAAQVHLGTLYSRAGNCAPAIRVLNAAAQSTSDLGALLASGAGLAQCREFGAAIQVLERALREHPQSSAAAYNLALAHYENSDFAASLQVLNSLAANDDAQVLFLRGKVGQAIRRSDSSTARAHDAAIADSLSGACRLQPGEDHCAQAALELIHQERFGEAAELLTSALDAAPKSAALLSALGLARFRLGRYRAAADAYSQAIEVDPSLGAAREGLGFLLYITGDLEHARTVVEAGIHRGTADFYLRYLRALILYRQSSDLRSEALASVSAAISQNPNFAPAYFLRGKIRSDQNESLEALNEFHAAVRIDPGYSLPYYRMARLEAALGHTSAAAEAQRRFSALGSLREDDVLTAQAKAQLTPEPAK